MRDMQHDSDIASGTCEGGGISRVLESLKMRLRAPLRAQGFWPTHECSAAAHQSSCFHNCATSQQGLCGMYSMIQIDISTSAATTSQREPRRICSMTRIERLACARLAGPRRPRA